ncbi:MAG: peptidylprolyl isomerase [Planctomycetaceae bacterium]|nr:peptidylprolyl isomerase [Planctomycetaceae bacterium]
MVLGVASAQEPTEDAPFSKEVLELLIESRTQKPASQASGSERAAAVSELVDIYLIASLPRAKEIASSPQIKAQIELQQQALIFNAFANDFLMNNNPSEQEIFNVYQEQVVLAPAKEFKARHILVDMQSDAIALIAELQAGADFVELAKANSTGPSAASGGDLGWFTAQAMVKEFSDAVALMEDGEYTSAPVQSQYGWHVIMREDSRDSAPPPLDSVRDVIVQRIGQKKFQALLASLRANAGE